MKYEIDKNCIRVFDLNEFSPKQIFDCGQIFRYEIFENLSYVVAGDKFALLEESEKEVKIFTLEMSFFVNYFDLDNDYSLIKKSFENDVMLKPCCDYGYGIRILKQDLYEMIISFIVSANNNIKRIKKSLNFLASKCGEKIKLPSFVEKILRGKIDEKNYHGDIISVENDGIYFYAFPKLEDLKKITIDDYVLAGLGYRAEQMYKTVQILSGQNLKDFKTKNRKEKFEFLTSLSGVGSKVANCVLLFGDNDTTSFPVDTWINKVYNDINKTSITNRLEIEKNLTEKYKELSGYAQQYFFYYYRENYKK